MSFKVATLNAQSLFTGFDCLKHIFNKYKFDIVVITETWLNCDISSDVISIDGYQVVREDRQGRGGGVAIYYKNRLVGSKLQVETHASLEQLWVSFKINNKHIGIGGIYRPPKSVAAESLNELENSISQVLPVVDEIIIAGDVNINLLNTVNSNSIRTFTLLDAYELSVVNSEPTRLNSLLDIIAISNKDLVVSTHTVDVYEISDHSLVYCEMTFQSIKSKLFYRTFRDFKYFNYDRFYSDLVSIPWNNLYLLNDVNVIVNNFNELLLYLQ